MSDSAAPLLELRKISKNFPGTRALDCVELSVFPGEVVTLLGENGAGKSTLMKILSGVWPEGSFEGQIFIQGKSVRFRDTRDAHGAGVAMIHQELSVFPELTVAEHLELDQLPRWIDWKGLYTRTQSFLDSIGLELSAHDKVGGLSIGGRQLVEIARALYRNAQILVFDEPTSALTESEVRKLYEIINKLRKEGHGIIYITHRMDEVFELSDRMVVLRDGKNAGEILRCENGTVKSRKEIEPKIITWMVGREIQDIYPIKNKKIGAQLCRVQGLTLRSPRGKTLVHKLDFELREGEILGFGGLLGAGRSETFEALFGIFHPSGPRGRGFNKQGNLWIRNKRQDLKTPTDSIRAEMAFVSEDRKGNGLVLNQSIQKNLTLPLLSKPSVFPSNPICQGSWLTSFVNPVQSAKETQRWVKEFKIKISDIEQPVSELSGGNQQKVVLAKWLLTNPEILFLDEPTRGIDVGSKSEIYQWIQRLASQGMGILLASSEMPELLGLCHRIIVLREGKMTSELVSQNTSQEEMMRAAAL